MFKTYTILRSPEGETSTGGSGANPFAPSSASSTPTEQTTQSVQTTEPAPTQSAPTAQQTPAQTPTQASTQQTPTASTPTAPSAVTMTPEQLQQLAASIRQPAVPAASGQPEFTEADFKKQFNVFEADAKSFENTFGVVPTPAQLAAYNDHLQAVARQAVTINRHLMDQRIAELQSQLQPVQQQFRQQTEQQIFNDFVTDYPGLKDYGNLLREITVAAQARGMKFNSLSEAKQFVAAQAAKVLNRSVDSFKASASSSGQPSTQTTPQQSGTRSMSTTSMGGRSGASGGAAPTQSTAERLFQGTT